MIKKSVKIINKLGLHARAAAKFVATASRYSSTIELAKKNQRINGKSIMGVMMLGAGQGSTLELLVSGDDEEEASQAMENLINNRFDEKE